MQFRVDIGTMDAFLLVRDNRVVMGKAVVRSRRLRLVGLRGSQLSDWVEEVDCLASGTCVTMIPLLVG